MSKYQLAIASSAGGFKGVFVHGVLSALETAGIRADAYGAASSSAFPSICAVIGQANAVGLRYWRSALETQRQPGNGMSEVVLQSIAEADHSLLDSVFLPDMPRFCIATSAVKTSEGAEQTQGEGARKLGRRLLVLAARKDRTWVDQNLEEHIFDTKAADAAHRLTRSNLGSVVYASTRMLHAWTIPAWVDEKPYVDASYTCVCPALTLAQQGYREVIAISNEPATLYQDMFQTLPMPERWQDTPIHVIKPEKDVATMGADFTTATDEGLVAVYEYGKECGRAFLRDRVRLQ